MPPRKRKRESAAPPAELRIIGGRWRRRKLAWHGDPVTRPMKDRVREAMFNLVGPSVVGTHALDLFGGTGALGLEAISRGAERATILERHFPTAKLIERNAESLDARELVEVVPGDAFLWVRRLEATRDFDDSRPWTVFVSPPWDYFAERKDDLLEIATKLISLAPPESSIAVESDDRFDPTELPDAEEWVVRAYPPAVISLRRL
jgi:16S rRNA (guanine966-N2)-methyltransferase